MADKNKMDPGWIIGLLRGFGVVASEHQLTQVSAYIDLLLRWNLRLNLTTIVNPEEIVLRHFGESMFLTKILPVENCRLADIGSGAGFPGLAIKVICPTIELTLIESDKRKCGFLAEVVRTLEIEGVEIVARRFEEVQIEPASIELLTARAIGELPRLLKWARSVIAATGQIALWIGGQDATRVSRAPGWIWGQPRRIPESQRRFILIGAPAQRKP